tara:strand:+ start:328 stop:1356 length:1029 start_codon:yes stop_codon:yes gene_type:complete
VNLSECDRILVIKPSSLGDIVHTLPAVELLHRAAPHATIDWLVNTEWASLLDGNSFLNQAIPFPRRELKGISGILRGRKWASSNLKSAAYDLVLDFQGLLRSALLAKSTDAKHIIGFKQAREGASLFYTQKVDIPDWQNLHAVDRNLQLVKAVGADVTDPTFVFPKGNPTPDLDKDLSGAILLHPFSRGDGKSLSGAEVLELCQKLAPRPVVLVGFPPERLPSEWPASVIDLLGKTSISQLIYLVRHCAWTVSVDSGPMHLAAGITDRVLSIHTWSNPSMVGPWQPNAWIWRDGHQVQVKTLSLDQFPERRDLKSSFENRDRLLEPQDIEAISSFINDQLHS